MNSGLVAFVRSSACADELKKTVSSAQADDRRGPVLPAPSNANSRQHPVSARVFARPRASIEQFSMRGRADDAFCIGHGNGIAVQSPQC
jgi:hypothetical protein